MKKKISMIALLMALLISVGGLTSSVSAKSKKVKCLGTYKITASVVVVVVLVDGEIVLLLDAEQKPVELSQSIEEKLNSVAK